MPILVHTTTPLTMHATPSARTIVDEKRKRRALPSPGDDSTHHLQSTHAIRKSCTRKIQETERNCGRIPDERSSHTEERSVSVQKKAEGPTARFEVEKETVLRDMEARGKELKEILESFRKKLSEERSDRLNREGKH